MKTIIDFILRGLATIIISALIGLGLLWSLEVLSKVF